jgi:imidazolonepropionase-like amidohydrolase
MSFSPRLSSAMLAIATASAVPAQQPAQQPAPIVLRAARLIDGTGAQPIANGVVVVTGTRITAVGREGSVTIPAGARRIDLGDATLLPGFIDAHTHISVRSACATERMAPNVS